MASHRSPRPRFGSAGPVLAAIAAAAMTVLFPAAVLFSAAALAAGEVPRSPGPGQRTASSRRVADVSSYEVFTGIGRSAGNPRISVILRKFRLDGETRFIAVDPDTLITRIQAGGADFHVTGESWKEIRAACAGTAYVKALDDAAAHSRTYQNAGITHFFSKHTGIALTIDLCPSARPLDRDVFIELVRAFGGEERPVPIAVAVTGVWMEEHGDDLEWLTNLERSGDAAITWINHSYHHRWDKDLPLKKNFLLEKGTDIPAEILRTEVAMLERGLLPSAFFRFPGLISDEAAAETVISYGLIPVGSDAWLGKSQWPKDGSIVLIHANGNEPIGVRRFLKLIREERADILSKKWLLLDLRESVAVQEKRNIS